MPRETKAHKRERALEIEQRMCERYPEAECALAYDGDPFRLTIAVMLSAQTTDAGVNKVTPELWRRYPTVADLAQADPADVQRIISTIGLYRTKAPRAVKIAQMVMADYGGEVPCDMDELQKLPGVGRKTANIVMNEGFGIVEGAARALSARYVGPINHQWVLFGREVCIARKPLCCECFLADLCPSCACLPATA